MTAPVLQAVTTAIGTLSDALDTLGTVEGASKLDLAPSVLTAQTAGSAIDAAIVSNDALVDTSGVFGIAAGVFPPVLLAHLLSQQSVMANQATLMLQKGAVGRILVNLGVATG